MDRKRSHRPSEEGQRSVNPRTDSFDTQLSVHSESSASRASQSDSDYIPSSSSSSSASEESFVSSVSDEDSSLSESSEDSVVHEPVNIYVPRLRAAAREGIQRRRTDESDGQILDSELEYNMGRSRDRVTLAGTERLESTRSRSESEDEL